jgi:flagellin-like hook-associated protein FlgL
MNLNELTERLCQEQLKWARRRLEALDTIEAKLLEMRQLAVYAACRPLGENERKEVQEWIDILQAEVKALDKETQFVIQGHLAN